MKPLPYDVLSIQSQVVYGRVGNSIAVPVLQQAGLNVLQVPTVLLGNTPLYASCAGQAMDATWLGGLLQNVIERGCLPALRALLVGYLGHTGQMAVITQWISQARSLGWQGEVLIDPVMGDDGVGVYVEPGLVEAYPAFIGQADVLFPNRFELECLCGQALPDAESVIHAARGLIQGAISRVIVTSVPQGGAGQQAVAIVGRERAEVIPLQRLPVHYAGTGDAFAATCLAARLGGADWRAAVEKAIAQLSRLLVQSTQLGVEELWLPAAGEA